MIGKNAQESHPPFCPPDPMVTARSRALIASRSSFTDQQAPATLAWCAICSRAARRSPMVPSPTPKQHSLHSKRTPEETRQSLLNFKRFLAVRDSLPQLVPGMRLPSGGHRHYSRPCSHCSGVVHPLRGLLPRQGLRVFACGQRPRRSVLRLLTCATRGSRDP